ncbi:hypothetical protein V8E52_001583, partial [Russula decolorans]
MDPAKLAKLQAQVASNRIGTFISATSGRIFIVRKLKPLNTQDVRKLQGALKLNVQPITGMEEINIFREDGNVLHFSAPKGEISFSLSLCTSVPALARKTMHAVVTVNMFAIYGAGQVKKLTELIPDILNQLGPDSL